MLVFTYFANINILVASLILKEVEANSNSNQIIMSAEL